MCLRLNATSILLEERYVPIYVNLYFMPLLYIEDQVQCVIPQVCITIISIVGYDKQQLGRAMHPTNSRVYSITTRKMEKRYARLQTTFEKKGKLLYSWNLLGAKGQIVIIIWIYLNIVTFIKCVGFIFTIDQFLVSYLCGAGSESEMMNLLSKTATEEWSPSGAQQGNLVSHIRRFIGTGYFKFLLAHRPKWL